MNLKKIYCPTYEDWPEIEQRGLSTYCMNVAVLTVLILASAVVAFYLYSMLMMQTPYFAGYETPFANAMREIDLNYMLPKILYLLAFGFVFSILVSIVSWFLGKKLYKKGEAAWKEKKEPKKLNKWIYRNGLEYYIGFAVFILGLNYVDLILDAKLVYNNATDVIVGAMAFITPGILLGALVAQKNAKGMARRFNLESKQITVWPYSIPFLITLCILVAAALGYPI